MTEREIFEKAIATYGKTAQKMMLIEEMSELTKEICKDFRGRKNVGSIAEEIADVEIMLEQIKMIYGRTHAKIYYGGDFFEFTELVSRKRQSKVKRLMQRLEAENDGNNE